MQPKVGLKSFRFPLRCRLSERVTKSHGVYDSYVMCIVECVGKKKEFDIGYVWVLFFCYAPCDFIPVSQTNVLHVCHKEKQHKKVLRAQGIGYFQATRMSLPVGFPRKKGRLLNRSCLYMPIGSMYGVFSYIWLIFMVNVGKFSIHGSYGI